MQVRTRRLEMERRAKEGRFKRQNLIAIGDHITGDDGVAEFMSEVMAVGSFHW